MSVASRSSEYGETWLDVVSAVDYLNATHRPELTVWDALEEAVRWWVSARFEATADGLFARLVEVPWTDPDPLRHSLERMLEVSEPYGTTDGQGTSDVLDSALGAWLGEMAVRFNDRQAFRRQRVRAIGPEM